MITEGKIDEEKSKTKSEIKKRKRRKEITKRNITRNNKNNVQEHTNSSRCNGIFYYIKYSLFCNGYNKT